MPKCAIIQCGVTTNLNRRNLTFHRLPQGKHKKRIWLEAIGKENLRTDLKHPKICSLHFHESSFNRTLNVIRLKDDAVPSVFIQQPSNRPQSALTARDDSVVCNDDESTISQWSLELKPSTLHQSDDVATYDDSSTANQKNIELDQALVELKQLQEKVLKQKKKIKNLNETVRRLKIKIETFKEFIKKLKENNLVTHENCVVLEQCAGPKNLILRQICKAKGLPVERQYPEDVRKFALTLNFLSPKAYDFVRTSYDLCLPHSRTLCKWYEHIDAEPGFCKEAFITLKAKVESNKGPVLCALILDEMSIRKSLCWDPRTQKFNGRVNTGFEIGRDTEVASQSLVFLLNCINGKWKLEVTSGIFPNNNLEG